MDLRDRISRQINPEQNSYLVKRKYYNFLKTKMSDVDQRGTKKKQNSRGTDFVRG